VKKLKFYALTAALMLGTVTLFLLAIEITLWWWSHKNSPEERDHVVVAEYMPVKFRPNYKGRLWNVPYSTNAYGFRDEPDFPPELRPGELRIFSLGDSIGFGVGIQAEEHYCKVAERALESRFPTRQINIVNASGQGYSPSGYFAYLLHEGLQLNPGIVIVEIELCNDLTDEALLHWRRNPNDGRPDAVEGGRYAVAWDGSLLGTYSLGGYPWERTYTYTDFVRRILNLLGRVHPSPVFTEEPGGTVYYSLGFDRCLLDQASLETGWTKLLTALELTEELCASNQIPFLVLIMPSRYIFDDSAPNHRDLALSLVQRAEVEIRRRKIPFLNMKRFIEAAGGTSVFFDFAHLNSEGNRAVGKALAERISTLDILQTVSRGGK